MIKYKENTLGNKIVAFVLFNIGFASIDVENDCTIFVFLTLLSIYLFFSKKNKIL